ncbi:hypothetical protein C1752_00502 [Acaryochloris thomasi RCC1774]|uniref:Uncharacterized protein n=1 Tax=Acaryochloris thomasi RCC1774 TaxID=1764569 RepID=A0A2W1JQI2_9CYAN|nr:hypothetical protein C1752_00502 [Acaryochloris thomasi RCC1774]
MIASLNPQRLLNVVKFSADDKNFEPPAIASQLKVTHSEGLPNGLQHQDLNVAFTTHQTNRLFCVSLVQKDV